MHQLKSSTRNALTIIFLLILHFSGTVFGKFLHYSFHYFILFFILYFRSFLFCRTELILMMDMIKGQISKAQKHQFILTNHVDFVYLGICLHKSFGSSFFLFFPIQKWFVFCALKFVKMAIKNCGIKIKLLSAGILGLPSIEFPLLSFFGFTISRLMLYLFN